MVYLEHDLSHREWHDTIFLTCMLFYSLASLIIFMAAFYYDAWFFVLLAPWFFLAGQFGDCIDAFCYWLLKNACRTCGTPSCSGEYFGDTYWVKPVRVECKRMYPLFLESATFMPRNLRLNMPSELSSIIESYLKWPDEYHAFCITYSNFTRK